MLVRPNLFDAVLWLVIKLEGRSGEEERDIWLQRNMHQLKEKRKGAQGLFIWPLASS